MLGLEVLAQLLSRVWRGELEGCFEQNLVGLMLLPTSNFVIVFMQFMNHVSKFHFS